jgi:hypothetical protein
VSTLYGREGGGGHLRVLVVEVDQEAAGEEVELPGIVPARDGGHEELERASCLDADAVVGVVHALEELDVEGADLRGGTRRVRLVREEGRDVSA